MLVHKRRNSWHILYFSESSDRSLGLGGKRGRSINKDIARLQLHSRGAAANGHYTPSRLSRMSTQPLHEAAATHKGLAESRDLFGHLANDDVGHVG